MTARTRQEALKNKRFNTLEGIKNRKAVNARTNRKALEKLTGAAPLSLNVLPKDTSLLSVLMQRYNGAERY